MPVGMMPEMQRLNIYDTYHTGEARPGHTSRHHARGYSAGWCAQSVTQRSHYYLAGTVEIDIVHRVVIVMSAFKLPQYGQDIIHKSSECRLITLIK